MMCSEIQKSRVKQNLTLQGLADMVNAKHGMSLDRAALSKIETGRANPGRKTLEAIADTLQTEWKLCQA